MPVLPFCGDHNLPGCATYIAATSDACNALLEIHNDWNGA